MRGFRAVLVAAAVALVSARAPAARAEPPAAAVRDVVVVEVDAGSSGVDAAGLRTAIGSELGADAVAPDDERASRAHGTIAVSIDRAAGVLVVSYREKGAPIVRRIDLPASPDATLRAAVLLAGNLARDEAAELTEMLRKRTLPPKPPAGELGPDEMIEREVALPTDPNAAHDLAEAKGTLDRYTQHHRTLKTALGWTIAGSGIALEATSLYLLFEAHEPNLGLVLLGIGGSLAAVSTHLFPNGRLEELERYYQRDMATGRPPQAVRDDLEAHWLEHARTERKWRRFSVVASGVLLGLEVGLAGLAIASSPSNLEWWLVPFYVGPVGLGAPNLAASLGPGPVEDALRNYERVTGRKVLHDGIKVDPVISPTLGGGTVGLAGRF